MGAVQVHRNIWNLPVTKHHLTKAVRGVSRSLFLFPLVLFITLSRIDGSSAQDACNAPLNATAVESKVWSDLCGFGSSTLESTQSISASFLEQIIKREPYAAKLRSVGLRLVGGQITGDVTLRGIKFEGPMLQLASEFRGGVDISDSQFSGSLSFRGAKVPLGLNASRTVVGGSLMLGDSDDTHYDGARSPVGSPLLFVSAPHSRIAGDVVISGATVGGPIDFKNAQVKGSLTFMHLSAARFELAAAEVDNQLVFFNCVTTSKNDTAPDINLYSLKTRHSVYFNRIVVGGAMSTEGADVAGDLVLLGTALASLNARSSRVAGSFIVGQNEVEPRIWTRWHGDSLLDLTSASFASFRSPEILSVWPEKILFHNFSFKLFSPDYCGRPACTHSSTWYGEWLGRQADPRKSFGPYKGVVEMLAAQGYVLEAQDLGVLGRDVERQDALDNRETSRYLLLTVYKYTIGYGYKLHWVLYWIFLFVCVGALIFRSTSEARLRLMPFGISYSFDMLLPIVRLREEHYEIDLKGLARYYFYLHKLVGWALGLLLAAAMSGIAK